MSWSTAWDSLFGARSLRETLKDVTQAGSLLQGLSAQWVVGDKGYDAQAVLQTIEQTGARAAIPSRSNRLHQRSYSKLRYRRRDFVERFSCRIKQYRRIASRYDKLAERFASFVCLVSAFICIE